MKYIKLIQEIPYLGLYEFCMFNAWRFCCSGAAILNWLWYRPIITDVMSQFCLSECNVVKATVRISKKIPKPTPI